MIQNYNKWKVLQAFFDQPLAYGGLQLREISRKSCLSLPSVKNYLSELEKEGLILKKKNRVQNYPTYHANRDNERFRFYKKINIVIRIQESGLLQELKERCMPQTIILFGSAARGEDTEMSDVDIFIESNEKKMDLGHFEKKIQRKINLFFATAFSKLSKELRNNLINGVILHGYNKVF